MADTLTAEALHNALVTMTVAYGAALADKNREIALMASQRKEGVAREEKLTHEVERLRKLVEEDRQRHAVEVKDLRERLEPFEEKLEEIPGR